MKIIAFYLPQFHQIPENDKWWGEGFTEWTNVRKAKPLFKGHYQPREPLKDNYYNILNIEVQKWQAEIAKKYGIYGFCYYHYWFNGKLLLEKPLEQILNSEKPNFPFCLSWANEPWTRRWDGREKDILMPQSYGDKEDWGNHFKYLLKFFLDKRYITIDGKPIFIIYRTSNISNCDQIMEYWERRSIENGLKGIYFIETLNSFQDIPYCKKSKGVIEFEPLYTTSHDLSFYFRAKRKLRRILNKLSRNKYFYLSILDYNYVWLRILNRKHNIKNDKQVFPGAFVDWDNIPRRGEKGIMFKGVCPDKFEKYLSKQIKRAKEIYNCDFIFLNAWNEWAEGAYLEPDKKYGYKYLRAVKNALDSEK